MALLLALALLVATSPAYAQINGNGSAASVSPLTKRVATLLEEAGFKYRKAGEGLWTVSFEGDNADSVSVAVQAQEKMVLLLCTVAKKVSPTTPQLRQLLEANYNANYAKLAIDDEGDLLALTELPPDVTSSGLRAAVEQVASLADVAFGLVTPGDSTEAPVLTETFDAIEPARGSTLSLLRGTFELSYDPAKWKAHPSTESGVTQFTHASGDLWLKVISERLEVAGEGLTELALENAKAVTGEVKLSHKTWRTVNGLQVLVLRYGVARSGVAFTFYNQMYSDKSGLIQLAAWTATNLFDEHRRDLLELFAGFRKVK